VVEATDRRFTRLKVLDTIVRTLETRLGPAKAATASAEGVAEAAAEAGAAAMSPTPQANGGHDVQAEPAETGEEADHA
jgi:hypothetical protein